MTLPGKLGPYTDLVRQVAKPFFAESGHDRVFVAACCGRVLVTDTRPELCGTCQQEPEVYVLTADDPIVCS